VEERLGPIDILVSNAGVQKRVFFLDLAEEDWDWIVDTNSRAAISSAGRGRPHEGARMREDHQRLLRGGSFPAPRMSATASPRPASPC